MASELQIVKKLASGFRTALNTQLKATDSLVILVNGPLPLKTSTVVSQVKGRQAECTECLEKVKEVLKAILSIVEKDDDNTSF